MDFKTRRNFFSGLSSEKNGIFLKKIGNIIKYILQFLQKWYNIKSGQPKGNFIKEENEFGKTFCLCG